MTAVALDALEERLAQTWKLKGVTLDQLPLLTGRVTDLRAYSLDAANDPGRLGDFKNLEAFTLSTTALGDAVLNVLAELPHLRALYIETAGADLARRTTGFPHLEALVLPRHRMDLAPLEAVLRNSPQLRVLGLEDCECATLPGFIAELPALRVLDVRGVPIPNAELAALRRARPDIAIRMSPVNLGYRPNVPGVLRVPDGFAIADRPAESFDLGCRVAVINRQVTIVEHTRMPGGDSYDWDEHIHGPVPIEQFVRNPEAMFWHTHWDLYTSRRDLRRMLEEAMGPVELAIDDVDPVVRALEELHAALLLVGSAYSALDRSYQESADALFAEARTRMRAAWAMAPDELARLLPAHAATLAAGTVDSAWSTCADTVEAVLHSLRKEHRREDCR